VSGEHVERVEQRRLVREGARSLDDGPHRELTTFRNVRFKARHCGATVPIRWG
jgi:hypothetical protein